MTASEAIISVLRRGSKKGLTASTIAERAKLNPNTVRTSLYSLTDEGTVRVVGTVGSGRGRPAHLYALAA